MDYNTTYTVTQTDAGAWAALAAFSGVLFVIGLAMYLLTVIGLMQFFKKAGKPGWAAFVPFYNYYVMTQLAGVPMYWFWILLASIFFAWLPVLGGLLTLGVSVYIMHMFLQKYGKDTAHTVLAVLFPYIYFIVVGNEKDLVYKGTNPSVTPPAGSAA